MRQVAPPVAFGEEGLLIDALVPASFPDRGPALWVGLRSWQILQRPSPRVLIVVAESDRPESLAAAAGLVATIGGVATVLAVTEEPEKVDALRESLKARSETAGLSRAEMKVRAGRFAEQTVAEQVESLYDLLVLDPSPEGRKHAVRSRAAISRLLEASGTPVLVMSGPWRPPARVLACTAVGEPGKTVVRVAGWLARGLGAPVTLLHVSREPVEPGDFVRAHLARGVAALRSFEVAAEARIRMSRLPAEGILAEARESEAGLIAIGGHGPRTRSIFGRDDVTMQILAAARMPVLVVPENAW